ncbi:MAG: hypothetical protein RIS70_3935 [Planctomycetota bacterium]
MHESLQELMSKWNGEMDRFVALGEKTRFGKENTSAEDMVSGEDME